MKYVLLIVSIFFCCGSYAQNLVPNASFEDTVYVTGVGNCPSTFSTGGIRDAVQIARGWSSFLNTPDYFNTCDSNGTMGVPTNFFGYRPPATGHAYCGLYTRGYEPVTFYREAIGAKLLAPLVQGEKYFASVKVALSNTSKCATNNLGISFSTVSYQLQGGDAPINNQAIIYSHAVITDTANWTTISGYFIADSNYQYVRIGNFFDDQHTDTIANPNGIYTYAYYYVDDVNVSSNCASNGGIVTSSRDSICYGTGIISQLSVSGNTGHIQWESSTDGFNFTAIAGDTLNTYTTSPLLAQTTYYRTAITDSCTSFSNIVAVHILPAPSTSIIYTANGKQYNFQPDSLTGGVISYHWDFGDGNTSNETNPVHTFDSAKTYYVCLTVYNRSNCSFTRCQYVSAPNGVQNISSTQNLIHLYPNPVSQQLTVSSEQLPITELEITDVLGQTLIQLNTYKTKTQIDVSSLAAGIYFVKTQLGDGRVEVKKFAKE